MFKMNIINKVYLIIDFFWFKLLSATYWRIFTFMLSVHYLQEPLLHL